MSDSINSVPAYYNDSLNLNTLKYNSSISDEAKMKEVGVQFESILMRQFLDESLKNLFSGMMGEKAPGADVYKGMIIDQLADSISRSDQTGMAKMYETQLKQMIPAKPAGDELESIDSVEKEGVESDTEIDQEKTLGQDKVNVIESIHQQANYRSF